MRGQLMTIISALGLTAITAGAQTVPEIPTVSGVLLMQSGDPQACVSHEDSAIIDVLKGLQKDRADLRSVAFAWDDVAKLVANADGRNILQPDATHNKSTDKDENSKNPTVQVFPDNRLFEEIAECGADHATNYTAARIWSLQVDENTDPKIAFPPDWGDYLDGIAKSENTFSTCLLMGGALLRQPAQAAVLAKDIEERIDDAAVNSADKAHDTRFSADLFNPNALRLRGWDLVLLSGLTPQNAGPETCAMLTGQLLQIDEEEMSLGQNPMDTGETCPVGGLAMGQSMRQVVDFETAKAELDDADKAALKRLQDCAGGADKTSVTIEAYGSVTKGSSNWSVSKRRANAVYQEIKDHYPDANFVSGGFGTTSAFGADNEDNQIAIVTVYAGDPPRPKNKALHSPLMRRHLNKAQSCDAMEAIADHGTSGLIPFLTSDFGEKFMAELERPNFVTVLHNQPDQVAFARELQKAASGEPPCRGTARREPHVGFLYKRTGKPFWQTSETGDGEPVTDFFILPPKLTWIYTTEGTPDFDAFKKAVDDFDIVSENIKNLKNISVEDDNVKRGGVDVLTYRKPTPLSTVLQALQQTNTGTGWVRLKSGWSEGE